MKNVITVMLIACLLGACKTSDVLTDTKGAGQDTGDGGGYMECQNTYSLMNNQKNLTLDIYYTNIKKWFNPIDGKRIELPVTMLDHNDEFEVLNSLLDKLAVIDPLRAKKYKQWALEFKDETKEIDSLSSVKFIPGLSPEETPGEDCEAKLVIWHQTPKASEGNKRYVVLKKRWDKLDPKSKAALILHELIFRDVREKEIDDPRSVQFFVSLIITDFFNQKETNHIEYAKLLKEVGIRPFYYIRPSNLYLFYRDLEKKTAFHGMKIFMENSAVYKGNKPKNIKFKTHENEIYKLRFDKFDVRLDNNENVSLGFNEEGEVIKIHSNFGISPWEPANCNWRIDTSDDYPIEWVEIEDNKIKTIGLNPRIEKKSELYRSWRKCFEKHDITINLANEN